MSEISAHKLASIIGSLLRILTTLLINEQCAQEDTILMNGPKCQQ